MRNEAPKYSIEKKENRGQFNSTAYAETLDEAVDKARQWVKGDGKRTAEIREWYGRPDGSGQYLHKAYVTQDYAVIEK